MQRLAAEFVGPLGLLLYLAACGAPTPPAADQESAPVALVSSAPRPVSFPTPDGGLVFADEYGSGARAVVLAHGGRFDKASWAPQARLLAATGLRVLAIDFRGYGQSHGPAGESDPFADLYLDVLGAVEWLRANGARSVAAVGGSMGGGALARALCEGGAGGIDRAVLMAHSTIATPERMGADKLFIVAREDAYGNGSLRLPGILEQYESAPEPKRLVILEGSAHAQFLFESDQGERLLAELLGFLKAP